MSKPRGRTAFVYLLHCADGTIYTGWTFDLAQRVRAHQQGRAARYTRARRPVELIYHEHLPSRRAAMRREVEIKRMSHARKLRMARGGGAEGKESKGAREKKISRAPPLLRPPLLIARGVL